jgi:YD repeat-containing protein
VTKWTDLQGGVISTTHYSKLTKFGDVVKAQVSCCTEKSFTFGENTYWSKPEQVTTGSPTGIHLTSSAVYSFASGTVTTQTDPNNQIVGYSYDGAMRPAGFSSPSGLTGSTTYNAWGPASSTLSYVEGGVTKSLTESVVYNGFGQVIQAVNVHGGQINTSYDAMGAVLTQTNPFPAGGAPGPATSYQYDVLGRVKVVTLPGGNTVQTSYSGAAVTVTDQVNRKIKRERDSLGRPAKVTEQGSAGALTQETTYSYNLLDKLMAVNQGNQLRAFKYDTAGRLLYERLPEQTATINDGSGTFWSTKYTYTDFDAVLTRTDARGVITTYGYDELHRLTSVTHNTSAAPGVATTPNITYTYDNNDNSATKGLLLSVSVGTGYSEIYSYSSGPGNGGNGGSRINLTGVTHTIDSRSYTVNYQYNNADQRTQMGHLYPAYDNKGRLQAVNNSAGVSWINDIAYNVAGQLTGDTLVTSGTVTNETLGYDANRMQLTSQTATRGGTTLMNLTYSYQATAGQNGPGTTAGNSGQLMSISGTINGTAETAAYTYDLWGRLTTSSQTTNGVSTQRRFGYDRWANRTGMWDATTGGNQIQSVVMQESGGAPTNRFTSATTNSVQANYSYDAAGNVTNDGSHSYVYDALNRIVSIDGTAALCAYDHQNRR